MVLVARLVAESDQSKRPGPAATGPSFEVEREGDASVDFLSLQVVEDVLRRLPFERDTVAPPRAQLLNDLEVRVVFDSGNEPAIVGVIRSNSQQS